MKKILIVDDQMEVRELVEVTLSTMECTTHQASSGREALAKARELKPDLIILDVMMPGGMDGYEVCRQLKGNSETSVIKILMLTARGQKKDRTEGEAAGADDYMVKPFSPVALLNKVEEVLG